MKSPAGRREGVQKVAEGEGKGGEVGEGEGKGEGVGKGEGRTREPSRTASSKAASSPHSDSSPSTSTSVSTSSGPLVRVFLHVIGLEYDEPTGSGLRKLTESPRSRKQEVDGHFKQMSKHFKQVLPQSRDSQFSSKIFLPSASKQEILEDIKDWLRQCSQSSRSAAEVNPQVTVCYLFIVGNGDHEERLVVNSSPEGDSESLEFHDLQEVWKTDAPYLSCLILTPDACADWVAPAEAHAKAKEERQGLPGGDRSPMWPIFVQGAPLVEESDSEEDYEEEEKDSEENDECDEEDEKVRVYAYAGLLRVFLWFSLSGTNYDETGQQAHTKAFLGDKFDIDAFNEAWRSAWRLAAEADQRNGPLPSFPVSDQFLRVSSTDSDDDKHLWLMLGELSLFPFVTDESNKGTRLDSTVHLIGSAQLAWYPDLLDEVLANLDVSGRETPVEEVLTNAFPQVFKFCVKSRIKDILAKGTRGSIERQLSWKCTDISESAKACQPPPELGREGIEECLTEVLAGLRDGTIHRDQYNVPSQPPHPVVDETLFGHREEFIDLMWRRACNWWYLGHLNMFLTWAKGVQRRHRHSSSPRQVRQVLANKVLHDLRNIAHTDHKLPDWETFKLEDFHKDLVEFIEGICGADEHDSQSVRKCVIWFALVGDAGITLRAAQAKLNGVQQLTEALRKAMLQSGKDVIWYIYNNVKDGGHGYDQDVWRRLVSSCEAALGVPPGESALPEDSSPGTSPTGSASPRRREVGAASSSTGNPTLLQQQSRSCIDSAKRPDDTDTEITSGQTPIDWTLASQLDARGEDMQDSWCRRCMACMPRWRRGRVQEPEPLQSALLSMSRP